MKEIPALLASQRKLIASLRDSRHRRREGLFTIEGTRAVVDTVRLFDVAMIVATAGWIADSEALLPRGIQIYKASAAEMERMSAQQTPQGVIAVCRIPEAIDAETFQPGHEELLIALDRIQDPGNLGTIIRIADWFGIRHIIASSDTVDAYNPKVVQSTMGSLARVKVIYTASLADTLRRLRSAAPVYGTLLDGDDLYTAPLTTGGVIVMGNEGNGISDEIAASVSARLRIPSYPANASTVESLNVAMATAITVAEFRRRTSFTTIHD